VNCQVLLNSINLVTWPICGNMPLFPMSSRQGGIFLVQFQKCASLNSEECLTIIKLGGLQCEHIVIIPFRANGIAHKHIGENRILGTAV